MNAPLWVPTNTRTWLIVSGLLRDLCCNTICFRLGWRLPLCQRKR
jgi:hypothetical protein